MAMLTLLTLAAMPALGGDLPMIRTMRVPDGGIQPQVVAQGDTVHLIYFTGDPKAGDVNYARSTDGGRTFAKGVRVNSEPASAIAIGTIRGPRLAVGKNGRVHVAWMGSNRATPRGPGNSVPMLYTRLNDAGDAFEPQRNVITEHPGLDGGGTVAADATGNVYVIWHAPGKPKDESEEGRVVWVARSTDEGKTFAPERRVNDADTGVCACCALEAGIESSGDLYIIYRSAHERVHRDMNLIYVSADPQKPTIASAVDRLEVGTCIMSTSSVLPWCKLLAWEGQGKVFYGPMDGGRFAGPPLPVPGEGKNRKHPRLAATPVGRALLVWTEDTAWNKGGSVAWQLIDHRLRPVDPIGHADGLPPWSFAAVFTSVDGRFTIIY
jgi:hypothetical protein